MTLWDVSAIGEAGFLLAVFALVSGFSYNE